MMDGWTGQLLRVNLSSGEISKEAVNMEWARDYIGGRGLATKYLYEEVDPTTDPLGPGNKLIFAPGPLTGTSASCGARYMVLCKSPLTGAIACSNSGGYWGPELKFAGYDMIIFEGKAEKPVYLWIYNDAVELRDASHLWGKGVWDTEDAIRAEVAEPDCRIAGIGPAGENLVRFACVVNDKHRAAGRSGVGAVMGSKNLKAVAVRGTRGLSIANPDAFFAAVADANAKLEDAPVTGAGLPAYGTPILVNVINEHGALPVKNFQLSQFAEAENVSGETLAETRLVAKKSCFACTIACGRVTKLPGDAQGKYMVTTSKRNWSNAGEGPEYENTWALGPDCGVSDLDAIIKANWLCNDYGMDPISFGATLAAAMELYEKGLIGDEQTDMPLKFGSGDALVAMAEKTAFREGFGNELAAGASRMTAKFGHPEFFMGVKGQEFPAYDPRGIQGMGLGYATSNRGACHLRSYTVSPEILGIPEKMDPFTTEEKPDIVKLFQDATAVVDSTGLCLFLTFGIGLDEIVPELDAATGAGYTVDNALEAGERIWNLERMFNIKAGITGADDALPKRITDEGIAEGPNKGMVNKLGDMLPEYYKLRGWDENGVPTEEKLSSLGLA